METPAVDSEIDRRKVLVVRPVQQGGKDRMADDVPTVKAAR
jgi:hypothetical protein